MDDAQRVRVVGTLEPYMAGFGAELTRLGYTFFSMRLQQGLVAHQLTTSQPTCAAQGRSCARSCPSWFTRRSGPGYWSTTRSVP
jgi:hypothetical protein